METFKVKYIHGQFIEVNTHQRIIPVQGAEYIISGNTADFKKEDEKLRVSVASSTETMRKWAREKFGEGNYLKLLDTGSQLIFRVGNSKKIYGDESREYIFSCTLQEDLYLFLVKGGDKKNPKDWRLANCICELWECLDGGLLITEKIKAESLNQLFTKTVMFYFNLQRSGSTNVFSTFCLFPLDSKITFSGFYHNHYFSLGMHRAEIIEELVG